MPWINLYYTLAIENMKKKIQKRNLWPQALVKGGAKEQRIRESQVYIFFKCDEFGQSIR